MAFSTAAKNGMLDSRSITHISAYNGDPLSGGVEVSSARMAATFGPAANGQRALQGVPLEIDIPAGVQVTHLAAHTAATGGSIVATHVQGATDVYGSAGKCRVTGWVLSLTDV